MEQTKKARRAMDGKAKVTVQVIAEVTLTVPEDYTGSMVCDAMATRIKCSALNHAGAKLGRTVITMTDIVATKQLK